MDYDLLLEKIKQCLISNHLCTDDNEVLSSVYNLFVAILGTPDILNTVFFNTVNNRNVVDIYYYDICT